MRLKKLLLLFSIIFCPKSLFTQEKGIFNVIGNEVVQGSLSVACSTTLSDLTVTGNATVGNLAVTNLTVNNEIILGNSTIAGTITGKSQALIKGSLSANNTATVSNLLSAGNFAFASSPPAESTGIPGFGGVLEYAQFYTQVGFTSNPNETIPLDTIGEISSGITRQSGNNYLTCQSAGLYLITFYGVASGNNSEAPNDPILLSIVINGETPSSNASATASGSETYNTSSFSSVNGYLIASLDALSTVAIINGGSSAITCDNYTAGLYDGVVANLIVLRIA